MTPSHLGVGHRKIIVQSYPLSPRYVMDPMLLPCNQSSSTLNLPSVHWRDDWCKAFLATAKHVSLLWLTSTRSHSFQAAYQVVTLVSLSPKKRRWTKGQDPREGLNSLFRVDCYQGCWLCLLDNNSEQILCCCFCLLHDQSSALGNCYKDNNHGIYWNPVPLYFSVRQTLCDLE